MKLGNLATVFEAAKKLKITSYNELKTSTEHKRKANYKHLDAFADEAFELLGGHQRKHDIDKIRGKEFLMKSLSDETIPAEPPHFFGQAISWTRGELIKWLYVYHATKTKISSSLDIWNQLLDAIDAALSNRFVLQEHKILPLVVGCGTFWKFGLELLLSWKGKELKAFLQRHVPKKANNKSPKPYFILSSDDMPLEIF